MKVKLLWKSIFRPFYMFSNKEAEELGLKWQRNVFGDEINHLNCRSIWMDKKGNHYCVENLKTESEENQ